MKFGAVWPNTQNGLVPEPNAFRRAGVGTVNAVTTASVEVLLRKKGFGRGCLDNLETALLRFVEQSEAAKTCESPERQSAFAKAGSVQNLCGASRNATALPYPAYLDII
jgi:hypothetical protein